MLRDSEAGKGEEAGLPQKTGISGIGLSLPLLGRLGLLGSPPAGWRAHSRGNGQISKENAEHHSGLGAGP